MSVPTIPPVSEISMKQAIASGIVSVALGEIALSQILNSQGEKIQNSVAILEDPDDILEFQRSVNRVLQTVLKSQMVLQMKLENLEDLLLTTLSG